MKRHLRNPSVSAQGAESDLDSGAGLPAEASSESDQTESQREEHERGRLGSGRGCRSGHALESRVTERRARVNKECIHRISRDARRCGLECVGVRVLSNSKPLTEEPAASGVLLVHLIAPPPLVTVSDQPAGELMPVGVTGIKPEPGIQENQKVPIVVVPVSLRVRSYWNTPGETVDTVNVAEAASFARDHVAVASSSVSTRNILVQILAETFMDFSLGTQMVRNRTGAT